MITQVLITFYVMKTTFQKHIMLHKLSHLVSLESSLNI